MFDPHTHSWRKPPPPVEPLDVAPEEGDATAPTITPGWFTVVDRGSDVRYDRLERRLDELADTKPAE